MSYRLRSCRGALVLLGALASAPALAKPASSPPAATATTAPARLRAASDALDAGDPDRALAILEDPLAPLDHHRALLRARAFLAKGALAATKEALAPITRDPPEPVPCTPACTHPLWIEATWLKARAVSVEDPAKAAVLLLALPADGARLSTAAAWLRKAKRATEASEAEARLLVEVPESREAKALAKSLGPKMAATWVGAPKSRLARVRRLLDAHENELARDEARALLEELGPKHAFACELLYVEGKAGRKLRTYGPAMKALARARKVCRESKQTDLALRAALLEVQVASIRRDVETTKRLALELAGTHAKHSYADDALFQLADVLERSGRRKEAATYHARVLDEHPKGDHAAESAWRLAYGAFLDGALDDARSRLGALVKTSTPGETASRARYWLARVAEEAKRPEAASLFAEAATAPPLGFYTWLALDRLRDLDPGAARAAEARLTATLAESDAKPPIGRVDGTPSLTRAQLLHRAGFDAYAAAELALFDVVPMSDDEAVALAIAYESAGAYREAQALLRARDRRLLSGFPSGPAWIVWRTAYSRPFSEEIAAAARESQVEPFLLTALAREESTFDASIVSWAGAIGLAQLMPDTAIGAGASLGLGRLDLERLIDPALNLRLGARVLRDNLRTFKKEVPLALAAYNAGPGFTKASLPKSGQTPFDQWVESLPIKETRGYVKRVTATWGIYRFLYDRERPFIDLPASVSG